MKFKTYKMPAVGEKRTVRGLLGCRKLSAKKKPSGSNAMSEPRRSSSR